MPKKESQGKTLFVTLVKSPIGYTKDQRATARALGLRRLQQTIEHKDTEAIRAMINKIGHLVHVEEAG